MQGILSSINSGVDPKPTFPIPGFAGSLSARIGVLLDYSMVSTSETTSSYRLENEHNEVPWQLRGSGFDLSNVLVWTHNFLPFTTLGERRSLLSSNYTPGNGDHCTLVKASLARVVLMCGPRAEEAIRLDFPNLEKRILPLRYPFTLYFNDDNSDPRIFIRCPELPALPNSVSYHHNSKIGEALRFAAKITGLEGVRSAFLESGTVVAYVLSRLKAERLGRERPMTTETIDPGVKFWLLNRGFTGDDDISHLEKLCGTLSRGILVVLHGRAKLAREGKIPPNSRWRKFRRNLGKQEVRVHEPFDPETYSLARAFYSKLAKASDKDVLEQCASDRTAMDLLEDEGFEEAPGNETDDSSAPEDMLPEEPHMEDLVMTVDPDIINSITNGDKFPLANPFKSESRKKRSHSHSGDISQKRVRRSDVRDWRDEKDRWRTTSYDYVLPMQTRYKERQLSIGHCRILVNKDLEVKDNLVHIWIEINPPGITHPNHYATMASPRDPASRLAFMLVYSIASTNEEVREYAFHSTYGAVCRANTFVDRICEDKSDEEIVCTPRRFLDIRRVRALTDSNLREAVESGFTDVILGLDRDDDEGGDVDGDEAQQV
ncbi:unnamed protein product [Fusarium equiseti]|uniref:Uncharacterized protein n=1 Tax=Fusarium equiseti TaxID=61235 RepID=A0A8J2IEJ0_FUSEQ|nr:unnamed protein product [Fusarium equiseti]